MTIVVIALAAKDCALDFFEKRIFIDLFKIAKTAIMLDVLSLSSIKITLYPIFAEWGFNYMWLSEDNNKAERTRNS